MRFRSEIVISIGALRLDVARVQRGQITSRASAWLDRITLEQAWHTNLHSLDAALAQLLRSVDAPAGAQVIVEYSGPSTTVDVISVPGSEKSLQDARRALADSSGLDLDLEESAIIPVGSSVEAGSAQDHYIGAADRDATLDALRNWVRRAGLTPLAFIPADIAAIQATLARPEGAPGENPVLTVHLGERRTIIALREGRELKLIRCVNIGTAALVDAAAGASAPDATSIDSSQRKTAFELLLRQGITLGAARAAQTDASSRLLPYINPVLQRYLIELRQTLRFCLTPQAAARTQVDCFGAGVAIPSFAATLASALELQIAPGSLDPTAMDSPHTIDLGISLECASDRISLTPESHRRARRDRRASRSMLVGAALAAFAVLGDAAHVWSMVSLEEERLARIAPLHADLTTRSDLQLKRTQLRMLNNDMYRAMRTAAADQPDWRNFFMELASAAHADMKFTDVSISSTSSATTALIRGVIALPGGWDSDSQREVDPALRPFMQALAESSSVHSAELGETRIAELNGTPVEAFAADLILRGLPLAIPTAEGRAP